LLGYTNKVDFQGVNQWIYGLLFPFEYTTFTGHGQNAAEAAQPVPNMTLEGNTITFAGGPAAALAPTYRLYVFANNSTTDPSAAVRYFDVAREPFNALEQGLASGTHYIRVQSRVPEVFIAGLDGVMWGAHSELSRAYVRVVIP